MGALGEFWANRKRRANALHLLHAPAQEDGWKDGRRRLHRCGFKRDAEQRTICFYFLDEVCRDHFHDMVVQALQLANSQFPFPHKHEDAEWAYRYQVVISMDGLQQAQVALSKGRGAAGGRSGQ